jgi:hypothetical protein
VGTAGADGGGRASPHHGTWTAVHLDAVEPIAWRGGELCWRLRLDGETVDAPTGTFLAVPPDVRRHAVAAEAGTEVLALGGPAAFEPSASEWIERARPHMRDRPERARAILDDLRRERPDSPGLRFGEALLAAAQGDAAGAREWLAAAIEREPLLRGEAAREPLLAPLLGETS